MSKYRDEDVELLIKGILESDQPQLVEDFNNGDYLECSYCGEYLSTCPDNISKNEELFKHDDNCPVVVAKDMSTGV